MSLTLNIVNRHAHLRLLLNYGMTLIEVMLILMLLIIIACAIIPFLSYHKVISATEIKDRENILLLKNALSFYKMDNGFYPSTEQGLSALVTKPHNQPIPQHWSPYLEVLPKDQWGKNYYYYNNNQQIELTSCGPPPEQQRWFVRIIRHVYRSPCDTERLRNN